jgi:hypothetical protein
MFRKVLPLMTMCMAGWGWLVAARMLHVEHWEPDYRTAVEYRDEVGQVLRKQYAELLVKLFEFQQRRDAQVR